MKNKIIANNGSIQVSKDFERVKAPNRSVGLPFADCWFMFFGQNIVGIPDDLKSLYKTVWEISQKVVIKMAADRGAFIDQSQSLNIHMAETNYGKLTSMHFYAWKMVSWE